MKPLRLAIVTRRFWPLVGAAERVLGNLAAELAARGCPVTILTARWQPHWPEEIHYRGVPVVRLAPPPNRCWTTLQTMRWLARWLRAHRDQFDLVYVSGMKQEAYAALRALGDRLPVVLRPERSGRGGDCLWQIEAPCGRRIKRDCTRAAALVARTPAIERELQAAGYPRNRIHYVPDGVPLPPPRTAATRLAARTALAEAHAVLELPEQAALAIYAGRVEEGRGLESLISAWSAIARDRPAARLWLVGPTPGRDAIQRHIDRLDMTNRVLLVGVFDEVDALLAAADLLVAPSPEGGAVAVLEAMAAQLPVVAVDAPSRRHLLRDGQEGLVVPGENTEALAAAVAGVISDRDLAARMGAAGRARIQAEFSLAKMADEHLTWFQQFALDRRLP